MRWRYLYLLVFLLPMAMSMLAVPLCMRMARRFGVVDKPGPRKIHRAPTPLLGGAAIFAGFSATLWGGLLAGPALYDSPWVEALLPPGGQSHLLAIRGVLPQIAAVYVGALLVFLLGLADDVLDLSVRMRLFWEFGVAIVVVTMGIRPDLAFLPEPLVWAVAVVWVVGITNAFNLLDGADGLASGVAIIAALILALVMALGAQPMVAVLLLALAGAASGFLVFNRPPARIFLGSSGSMFLGYMLSVTVLVSTFMAAHTTTIFPILIPVLVLSIPLYDTFSVIVIRLLRGQPIALADQNHLIHRLMRIGFSTKQGVLFIYLLAVALGFTSPLLVRANFVDSLVIFGQLLCVILLVVIVELVSARRVREREKVRAAMVQHGIDPETLSSERLPSIIDARDHPEGAEPDRPHAGTGKVWVTGGSQ